MRRGTTIALGVVIGVAGLAPGLPEARAEAAYSTAYTRCMDESGGATFRMIDCMTAETDRQDTLLNANYRAAMSALSPARKVALRDAQRLWIAYRDANCGFYYDPDGGQAARVNADGCYLSMTAERAEELGWIARAGQ